MTDEQKKEQLRKFFSDEEAKKKFEQELQNYKGVEPDLDTMYKIAGNVIAKDVKGASYDSIEKPNSVEFPLYKFDAMGNRYDRDYADYPEFKVEGNKIKLAGSPAYLKSDVVQEAKKAITDYYKGYDLTNNQVAENIQKTIDEVNSQVKSNLQYQEYNDFLQKSNFSDEAYRNYALAKQDADPKATTNLLKSKNKYKGYKKDGSMDELTAKEWLEYWKKEYTPEERIQLWMDSSDALARAESDEDLYKGLAYILMGAEEKQNVPAGALNAINPFNDKGYEDAKFYGPIYGFDDISSGDKWKAFWDAFLSTNREALGRLVKWAGGQTEPLQRALGGKYGTTDVSTPEKWGKTVGLKDVTFDTVNMSKKEWDKVANLVNKYFGNADKNTRNRLLEEGTEAEILTRYEGKDMAAKILWVRDFSKLPSTGDREKGWNAFQSFKNNYELRQSEGYKSPYEKWGAEREREMQKHIERLSTIAPNATTWGMIGGTVARIAAEQAALGALSSGSLTAQNIAKTLTQGGWKLTGNVLDAIGVGQNVASKSANLTAAITALAGAGGAGLTGASKALYALGSIGTWAVREMGEDVVRGLVDDAVTANSFDSQGNLDPTKLAENVYMNAIMYGAAKGIKGAAKGLATIVDNAKTRNIDGVELNVNQRNQINLFQKALDDQNPRYQFRGYDSNGHPVITVGGKAKVLDQLTPSGETAKAIEDATGAASPTAARTAESILDDQDVSNDVKQKISEVVQTAKEGDAEDIKVKIQESLTDDEIRQAFPDGTMKVGDQTIRIDTKDFTAGDVGRVTGKEYKTMEEAIEGLSKAVTTRDFASAVNGIMRYSGDWAKNFKEAVQSFAEANNMSVRDVMIAIRESRLAGQETIPGLKQLWEENWKPVQERLLDLQEQLTGIRPVEHDFYFRDMLEGTYIPGENGTYSIDQGNIVDQLGGDAEFDLAASSTARNTGKLGEIAPDKLEYDPEVLAQEYVASRMKTIWQSDDMGKIYATLQEAHEAGEYGLTEAQAAKSVGVTETVAREVGESEGVKEIENLSNVTVLGEDFGAEQAAIDEDIKDIDAKIKAEKDNIKAIKEETTYEWEEDGKTVKKTLNDNIKDTERQLAEQQAEVDSFAPKTDPSEVPKMDYKVRNELAKSYADRNPEYIVAYRRQPKGVDKWYSNGTGTRAGNLDDFSSYGSDKGDLTNAVWLTTDEKWASGKSKASAGNYNGAPDQTVVVLIPKSLIVDGGGEQPLAPKGKGEFTDSWGNDRYTIRGFSRANDNKIVQTRATESDGWFKAREANEQAGRTPVTDAMRFRLNPDFYEKTELVLFRDTQPDIIENSNKLILEEYNSKHKVENEFFAKKAQRTVDETQSVLDELLEKKQKLDNAEENLKNLEETKKQLQDARTPEGAARQKTVTIESDGDTPKTSTGKTGEAAVEEMATLNKKQIVDAQKKFNESASKSDAAKKISNSSGYINRGVRVNPGAVVGVNYMPSNPFGKFAKWINDHFVKANSIKMRLAGYKADGTHVMFTVTAYNGGYKMYAEAGTFARNVIVDIQRGDSMYDAIYKQIRNNGFFIEPSKNQKIKYGALSSNGQAAKITDKIMDRMLRGNNYYKWSDAFNDDGTVKDTTALISILTTRFRGQGIADFTKFVRKATWDSFTKGEQEWLNRRMYEMTASVNKKSFATIAGHIAKFSMGLRYRSNMWFNYKNGQLQLTECQRLFTMNKIGDFNRTLKRLVSDPEYRQRVSDYAYIHAAESVGRGLSRTDLDKSADAAVKVGAASTISKNGIFTDIDNVKAKFGDIDDTALASIEGAEYAKNYILIAGFVAAGEKQGLEGAELDTYVRNRFNTEALAGTKVGKIGLTDSKIGQFAFMYLGFPIRELALQWHTIRGGGLRKDFLGSVEYLSKMLGAKGLMWAAEAPWGYSLMDQLDLDPFGWTDQYSQMPNEPGERTPFWGGLDVFIQYNPFFQGAMTSALADIYFAYRAAQETAREEYKAEHNGSAEGFEWSLADAGGEMWHDLVKGLTPGYTEYSRIAGEVTDLDRGYRISATGNRLYQPNTDPGNVFWAMLSGARNTPNAQDYYQTASPIRGAIEGGLPGLGQNILRGINPFRGYREFDPTDSETYSDWFDGTYADQQNWNTGIYAFRDEAQQIKEKYDKYAQAGTAVNDAAARENELAELRDRVETYVNAYTSKHPEGISSAKQNQIINIFNLGQFQPTLNEAFAESQGQADYSDWDAAKNRYSQGNFPTAYGLKQNDEDEASYVRSPQLEQVLSQQRYGIASDVAPTIEQMYKTSKFDTPLGNMTMKDYHDKVYAQLQEEWDKDKPDYDKITKAQEEYLEYISKNIIQPILNTYGSTVLSAGKSSDIMQEFGKMLYSMVPSDEYRIDKKGKQIYKSTPYMTIDIPKWLNKNFTKYTESVNTTNRATKDRIQSIRNSIDQGHKSTAIAKAKALISDIGRGKASVSRDELEWLQGVLND